jgi:selenocysteine lyase/cysteine desulfurase
MIYFNHAAGSYPKYPEVMKAACNSLKDPQLTGRGTGSSSLLHDTRLTLAKYFGVGDEERVVFNSGGTEGLNQVIFGLLSDHKSGKVLSTVTEHNSVLRPLYSVADQNGLELEFASCDSEGYVDCTWFKKQLTKDTRAIIINHCSNVTGAVQSVEELIELSQEYAVPLVLDGCQSAGAAPISLERASQCYFIFTAHKSLLGLAGSGGIILPPHKKLKPWKFGGTGAFGAGEEQPHLLPYRLEAGTQNHIGIAAVGAGVELVSSHPEWQEKKHRLVNQLIDGLSQLSGIRLYCAKKQNPGVVSFSVPDLDADDVAFMLSEGHDIQVRSGLMCAPLMIKALKAPEKGVVRVSLSAGNTETEIDSLLQAVAGLV